MTFAHRTDAVIARAEKRVRKRSSVGVRGKLFLPQLQIEGDCTIVDLSTAGAGLKSTCSVALGMPVVVYIDGFGRYQGTVVRRDRLRIGVQFTCSESKEKRLAEQIENFVAYGRTVPTSLRGLDRLRHREVLHDFRLKSGQSVPCEIMDMALSGASLKTRVRPPVGEEISFGSMSAVIMRHTEYGIGVKFTGPAPLPPVVTAPPRAG
jgi:hypothetical protein